MHNIALAGFMGTGKSTVGPLLAARLGFTFHDADAVIVAEAGQPITQIFAERGEAAFREIEARVCEHLAWEPQTVIALGGGALLNERTLNAFLAGSLVVCLTAPLDAIIARVGEDPARPLFGDRAAVTALYNSRVMHYAALPHHVSTEGRPPEAVAEEIATLWHSTARS